ncbi:hypothetical protein FHETE_131 [Fusarium heterosporum]|uniref:Uncharacterized protein n=1 Tax=Fusarium heterosporum TaxID=42747 RepID=A0A8H5TZ99_FUSHE|nr:hypothetical protein FHETE_131 [Fusarium heterosporum]
MSSQDDENEHSGQELLQNPQLAEVRPLSNQEQPVQHVHASLAPTTPLPVHPENMPDNITATSSGRPFKQPCKPRTRGQASSDLNPKKFRDLMVQFRLDHWRARAKVVYIDGQIDMTALWSPQWAGVVSADEGMNLFDGFDRTWFIPFDSVTPLSLDKQNIADDLEKRRQELQDAYIRKIATDKQFASKLSILLEEEVQETCRDQWDTHFHNSNEAPTQWRDVRETYQLNTLVLMIARARLASGRELLSGYHQACVLEMGIDSRTTYQRVSVPTSVNLDGYLSRLNSWYPPEDKHSEHFINAFKQKFDFILEHGDESQKRMAQRWSGKLNNMKDAQDPRSERGLWCFKLRSVTIDAQHLRKKLDGPRSWKELDETTYQWFIDGVRQGKHPVFARKVHLHSLWPKINTIEEKIEAVRGGSELSSAQLDIVDELLARRTDEEREQAARYSEALKMAKLASLGVVRPSTSDNA